MPEAITLIDVQNVQLLDKIFTLFSFSFKYLIKEIRADIKNFYELFGHLLMHKNKHLRKFAAQSFSYVLRKSTINFQMLKLIFKPLSLIGSSSDD